MQGLHWWFYFMRMSLRTTVARANPDGREVRAVKSGILTTRK
jgi:hypothetical protein